MRRLGLLLAVLALAACGGDGGDRLTKDQYQSEVQEIGKTLGQALAGLTGFGPEYAALGRQVTQLQETLRATADGLDELLPPEEIENAHDTLVEGIRGFADELDELKDAAEDEDADRIREFEDDFTGSESVQKIRDAADELQEKGYTLE